MDSKLEINIVKNISETIVHINGLVSTDTAPILNEQLLKLDYEGLNLTIDMAETDYITSAGLRALLVARKKLTEDTMRVVNANKSIVEIFKMTGFDSFIKVVSSNEINNDYRLSIAALLQKRVETDGEKTAYIFLDRKYTWNDVDKASHIIADKLSKIGVGKGTHVGLCSENSPNWVFTLHAIQKLGGIAVLINPLLLPNEVCALSKIADVTHLCYGETEGKTTFESYSNEFLSFNFAVGTLNISNSVDFTKEYDNFNVIKDKYRVLYHADDPAAVIFSSGSTGAPKAILSSSYSMISGTEPLIKEVMVNNYDINLSFLPMFHIFGFAIGISVGLMCGYMSVIPENKHPDTMIQLTYKYKCTLFCTVPTMLLAMLASSSFSSEKLATLNTVILGGSVTTEEQLLMLQKVLPNTHFCNLYGMSENPVVSMTGYNDTVEHITKTVGKPSSNLELVIRDINGNSLPTNSQGEICIRGDTMATCYYKLPVERQPVDDEGWLSTGDLGFIDNDGYLHITGRIKDLIICGGENISPGEIAEVLSKLTCVQNVKVLGIPDEIFGEVVTAAIIVKDGSLWDEEKVRAFAAENLAKYKLPVHYVLFEEFPLLANGKIDGLKLKKLVTRKIKK